MKLQASADNIKKIEALFITAALVFLPLGMDMVTESSGDTTKFLMGICLTVVGVLCGAVYIWVEKSNPDDDEDEKETKKVDKDDKEEE